MKLFFFFKSDTNDYFDINTAHGINKYFSWVIPSMYLISTIVYTTTKSIYFLFFHYYHYRCYFIIQIVFFFRSVFIILKQIKNVLCKYKEIISTLSVLGTVISSLFAENGPGGGTDGWGKVPNRIIETNNNNSNNPDYVTV